MEAEDAPTAGARQIHAPRTFDAPTFAKSNHDFKLRRHRSLKFTQQATKQRTKLRQRQGHGPPPKPLSTASNHGTAPPPPHNGHNPTSRTQLDHLVIDSTISEAKRKIDDEPGVRYADGRWEIGDGGV
ncbi:hypothetical protein EVG20_g2020 [Dentipellis fragilis]|uniref:Uncharacterized protein n=1 Tax=Dentipellis fragilis TaxID=205917 RepID=A0A4Y9Z7X7_9AGAM|nr:hypothetical protein EVG20_g2020 [Dentipellis fragilis]